MKTSGAEPFARTLFLSFVLLQPLVATAGEVDRTVLPIADPVYETYSEVDARNASMPETQRVTAPQGAPNVVIVLVDDLGFGTTSTFGGPIRTPTLDRLAGLQWLPCRD